MQHKTRWLALLGIFLLAAVSPLERINHPYFSLLPLREDRSATSRLRKDTLEPLLMGWLTAELDRLAGGEQVWVRRLLSTTFWLAGGLFLLPPFIYSCRWVSRPARALCQTNLSLCFSQPACGRLSVITSDQPGSGLFWRQVYLEGGC